MRDSDGMLVNLLSGLAIVGPALVVSNIVVAKVQTYRTMHQAELDVALINILLWSAIDVARDCLEVLRVERPLLELPEPGHSEFASMFRLKRAIEDAQDAIHTAYESPGIEPAPHLELLGHPMATPPYANVLRFMERLDTRIPCRNAVMSAIGAADWTNRVNVDFVYRGGAAASEPISDDDRPGLWQPETGLNNIATWFDRATDGTDRGPRVGAHSYFRFVEDTLQRALWITEAMIQDLPEKITVGGSE
ncbi:hypothetical protein ACWDTI_08730 [Gordonia sp. NPDC003424]